ncbi:unnamed protein product [Ostreobium quekettii]|uniref:Peptidase S1 domain-containing protein n=1 Tax=Ostreobium quekettii TaxID=121088 RepID=A0A8S1JBT6_9CHLO|nr:unnamed protein product [Ostreobium quekettii]
MVSPAVLVALLVACLADFPAGFAAANQAAGNLARLRDSSRPALGGDALRRAQQESNTGDVAVANFVGRQLKNNGTKEPRATLAEGVAAECGRFPYMVSLRDHHDEHKCGGVLVDPHWVVTAAHCVDPTNSRSAGATPIAVIGACSLDDEINKNGEVETFLAQDIFLHEKWTGNVADEHDVALVELNGESSHKPVGLPTRRDSLHENQRFAALGWGVRGDGAAVTDLQQAGVVSVVENEECESERLWGRSISNKVLCAFGFKGDEICEGDSGGPLVRLFAPGGNVTAGRPSLDVVVGIASYREETARCGESKLPGVFTRLASFRKWIDGIMEGTGLPDNTPDSPTDDDTISMASAQPPAPSNDPFLSPQVAPSTPQGKESPKKKSQRKLDQALFRAATQGDLGGALRAWRKGASIDATHGVFGETPLHVAAHNGHADVVEFLLQTGAAVDDLKSSGTTPLFVAAQNGHIEVVRLLLASGAEVDRPRPSDGVTPLFISAQNGHADVVAALLDADADPNKLDNIGEAPLHIAPAAVMGSVEVTELLIEAGGEVDARGVAGLTPLLWAAYYGNLEVARTLVGAGADKDALGDGGEGAVDLICVCLDNRDDPNLIQCPEGGCEVPENVEGLEALLR